MAKQVSQSGFESIMDIDVIFSLCFWDDVRKFERLILSVSIGVGYDHHAPLGYTTGYDRAPTCIHRICQDYWNNIRFESSLIHHRWISSGHGDTASRLAEVL